MKLCRHSFTGEAQPGLLVRLGSRMCRGIMRHSILHTEDCVRLRAFLSLDDVELDVVSLFEGFVSIQLNCRIVDEYIGPIIPSDKSIALGIVEPLDLSFVLGHSLAFLAIAWNGSPYGFSGKEAAQPYIGMTIFPRERLIGNPKKEVAGSGNGRDGAWEAFAIYLPRSSVNFDCLLPLAPKKLFVEEHAGKRLPVLNYPFFNHFY